VKLEDEIGMGVMITLEIGVVGDVARKCSEQWF